MYFLSKFCCFCSAKDDILDLSNQDSDGITHIHKLTASVVGMDFEALDVMRFICGECCTTLNTVYRFQQNCLRSKRNLATYVSQLQMFSRISGSVSVCLRDIRQETEAEDQSFKNQSTLTNMEQEDSQSTVSDHAYNVYIKQECDSEENHFKEEDANMDYCNEFNLNNLPKVENEHETENHYEIEEYFSNLDEDFIENLVDSKEEIDIEEHPVCEVKEEAVLDSEVPAEGPSQGHRSAAAALDTATGSPVDKGREHRTDYTPYECCHCKKIFDKKMKLTKHLKIHNDETKLECDICEKKFVQTSHLKQHMRTHTGEKPYECDVCKKRFAHASNRKQHMRTHTGEKPYECGVCKKRFAHYYLKEHMRTHTSERPYECDVCKKGFIFSANFRRHMRTHTGEKKYGCDICMKSFSSKKSLIKHKLKH